MQEQKELLLKDLSARLPYGVKCHNSKYRTDLAEEIICCHTNYNHNCVQLGSYLYKLEDIKPYLFPLSSMTKEQSKTYHELVRGMFGTSTLINFEVLTDFFHKNHLDYRGLIPMGLAIDATGLNILL